MKKMAVLRVSNNRSMLEPRLTINLDLSGEDNEPVLEISEVLEGFREEQYISPKRLREIIGNKAVDRAKKNLLRMLEKLD